MISFIQFEHFITILTVKISFVKYFDVQILMKTLNEPNNSRNTFTKIMLYSFSVDSVSYESQVRLITNSNFIFVMNVILLLSNANAKTFIFCSITNIKYLSYTGRFFVMHVKLLFRENDIKAICHD